MQVITDIAYAALALLIATLAVYLSLKLMGKLAKFLIILIVIGVVVWFLFSDHSFVQSLLELARNAKEKTEAAATIVDGIKKLA